MRLSSLTLGLAFLAGITPCLAQSAIATPAGPTSTINRAQTSPVYARPAKDTADADRRLLAEERRMQRIMTICTGC